MLQGFRLIENACSGAENFFFLIQVPKENKVQKVNHLTVFLELIGTLRSEDGDGRENVPEKVNSCSFNLHRDYFKSLTFSNVGEAS